MSYLQCSQSLKRLPSSGQRLYFFYYVRGTWKGTSKAAGLQKTWPRSLWFFSRWPVTSPRDSCTCINTTSHTGRQIFLLSEVTQKLTLISNPYQYNLPSLFVGHFLEQYPGAARVFPTDSSISDFVAGADPPSAEFHSHFQRSAVASICLSLIMKSTRTLISLSPLFSIVTWHWETAYCLLTSQWRLEIMGFPTSSTRSVV